MIELADVKQEDNMVYFTVLVDGFTAGGLALPADLYGQFRQQTLRPLGRPSSRPVYFCGGCGKEIGRKTGPKLYPDGKPRCSKCAGEWRRQSGMTEIQADLWERWNTFPELTLTDMAEFYGVTRQYISLVLDAIRVKGYEVRPAHGGAINPLRVCAVCRVQLPTQFMRHPDGSFYCREHRPIRRDVAAKDEREEAFLQYMLAAEQEGRPTPSYSEAADYFGVSLAIINRHVRHLRDRGIEPPHRPIGQQRGGYRGPYRPRAATPDKE